MAADSGRHYNNIMEVPIGKQSAFQSVPGSLTCGPPDEEGAYTKEGSISSQDGYGTASITSSSHEVRVVQIFNPVLVKTDVANFRPLVQRLTGKSGCSPKYWNKLRRLSAALQEDGAAGPTFSGCTVEVFPHEDDDEPAEDNLQRRPPSMHHHRRPRKAAAESVSSFSELDIHAALISDGPLPDITMLPPLTLHLPPASNHPPLCT
ncbi:hypothetical protein GOP47_0001035 [Adiantum capillus-veneris]|uniref:VQ domain-containing protein n=1 Tax=Adiantum capillus-veneris TaxID=13818 RepID=A0A9D4ZSU5_ADICA|nr:hypothetical protein GOP47_0001035 [Adiantum capillus-veneris]